MDETLKYIFFLKIRKNQKKFANYKWWDKKISQEQVNALFYAIDEMVIWLN